MEKFACRVEVTAGGDKKPLLVRTSYFEDLSDFDFESVVKACFCLFTSNSHFKLYIDGIR